MKMSYKDSDFKLIELNEDNYLELSKLKINDKQKEYVMDFNACLKYQKEYPFLKIYGVKYLDHYIGLTAFAKWIDPNIKKEEQLTWFDEFYISEEYQHLGFARVVVPIILKKIKELYKDNIIVLSVVNENKIAKNLYKELGFIETNYIYDKKKDSIYHKDKILNNDEIMMYIKLDD